MFYMTYIYKELSRRLGRTILTVLGLGLGVGLVAALTALSNGLDAAQKGVLSPLASVGTDLLVTRSVGTPQTGDEAQGPGPGGPGLGQMSPEDRQALVQENATVLTDLAKLGNPGDKFVHDSFVPATQLTFPQEQSATITAIDGVDKVAVGLTLTGVHQEGTIPQIVAEFQTGGERVDVTADIPQLTPEEEAQVRQCMEQSQPPPGDEGQPPPGRGGFARCLPERLRQFRGSFTTPERTIRRNLGAPTTDIKSETYTIGGVDMTIPGMGLLTKNQITKGLFFTIARAGANPANPTETVVAESYAERKKIEVGGEIDLNGTKFKVVGLARPPLGGQAADIYLPLGQLQTLSGRAGRVNVLLVTADNASAVSSLESKIEDKFPGATVTSAKDVADKVSGSLVDASNLADRLGLVVSLVMLASAFLLATLLTLSSVNKRVRELGTLKAIGWPKWMVVRQVVGESIAQGLLGGIVGIGLGVGGAYLITQLVPPLQATAASGAPRGLFGLGAAPRAVSEVIHLQANVDFTTLAMAMGLAIAGGLIAGGLGALRAARLRPAAALRDVG